MRYYIGIDWADQEHRVWIGNADGHALATRRVPHSAEGFAEFGRWLDEQRAAGHELWVAIERPDGRLVDFLLDHGVVVYPVNPKALDRARDRYRASASKDDAFDAFVLGQFLRTDHEHLHPLMPSSPAAEELKLLARDAAQLVRQQTRLLNQLPSCKNAGLSGRESLAGRAERREEEGWPGSHWGCSPAVPEESPKKERNGMNAGR